ncbi:Aste57867_21750 [Aphanomyces stellatus]|uniref:Aste57867_21750 protein n=1 Tax=Aphanomyces stellatus TaxID=120398 RepID=A0A485LKF4_9STRA|nr:hypothetical protein As57867_021681 [Aphanomyces stellatus]VFT98419.1 Aste57867_21750 [Aphanomyces stellatus]
MMRFCNFLVHNIVLSNSEPQPAVVVDAVLEGFKLASTTLVQAVEMLNEQGSLLETKKLKWAAMCDRIATHVATAADFIPLNVGSLPFTVPKTTLLKHEDGYFHAMLGSGHWKPDGPTNSYLFDVEPTTFHREVANSRLRD